MTWYFICQLSLTCQNYCLEELLQIVQIYVILTASTSVLISWSHNDRPRVVLIIFLMMSPCSVRQRAEHLRASGGYLAQGNTALTIHHCLATLLSQAPQPHSHSSGGSIPNSDWLLCCVAMCFCDLGWDMYMCVHVRKRKWEKINSQWQEKHIRDATSYS